MAYSSIRVFTNLRGRCICYDLVPGTEKLFYKMREMYG